MSKILFKNADIYNESGVRTGNDVLAVDGVIEEIGGNIECDGAEVIDCTGLAMLPGLCDMHVHFRDPGLTYKEDIITGCASAAAGGVTAVACMPNTKPVCDSPETVRYMIEKAKPTGVAIYPVGAITQGMSGEKLTDFDALKAAGCRLISDDGKPVEDAALLLETLKDTKDNGLLVASHCEDLNIINGGIMHKGSVSEELGVKGMDRASEDCVTAREVALAASCGARVHICHVSTKGCINMIRAAKADGVRVTCETAPHYFTYTHEKLRSRDADYRMNPPLREQSDVDAVLEGVLDGTVDCIVTDHAPHAAEEKADFLTAPNGVVGLETSFAATLTRLYHTGRMSIEGIVKIMSAQPRRILGIVPLEIKVGEKAEIILADLNREWVVDPQKLKSKAHNTVFKGERLKGKVVLTYADGRLIYREA